jgi:hypothetical protein
MTLLGALTSACSTWLFNGLTLPRNPVDYLVWGRRTSFPPFLILLVVALGATVVVWLRRALIAMIPPVRRLDGAIRSGFGALAHRLRWMKCRAGVRARHAIDRCNVGALMYYYRSSWPLECACRDRRGTETPLAVVGGLHNNYRGFSVWS